MTRFNLHAVALLTLALLFAPRLVHAASSYDNCTGFITSIPAVISTQGTWCLKTDLSTAMTSGSAITINTNNVTIDCNDFKLGGLAAGVSTNVTGILASNRQNATVRHCNIRGFVTGLYFSGSGGGHAVEDNRFDGNTGYGIWVEGDGSVVRRNRVFATGGSTLIAYADGIVTQNSVDILGNTVSGLTARIGGNGSVTGIVTLSAPGSRIIGNGVRGLLKDGAGSANGIYNNGADRLILRNNDLVGDANTGTGLLCQDANARAKDNTISGFATAISTCNDSGGNALIP